MHASCQTCPAPPARLGAGRVGGWGTLDQAPGGEQREEHRQADHHQRPAPTKCPTSWGCTSTMTALPRLRNRSRQVLPPGAEMTCPRWPGRSDAGGPAGREPAAPPPDGDRWGRCARGYRLRPPGAGPRAAFASVVASPLEMSTIAAGALGGGAFPGDCGLGAPVPAPPPAGLACSCSWGTVATATARASPGAASAAVRRRPRAGPTAPWSRVGGSRRYAVWE